MTLESRDRLHAKQGRSTARVVFHGPGGPAAGLPQAALPAPLAGPARRPWSTRAAGTPRRRRVGPPRTGPGAGDRRPRGRRRRRADRALGRLAELPDGRRADRLRAAPRGHPRAGGPARPRRVRRPEARPDRRDGRDRRDAPSRPGLPQGSVPLPLLPRHRPARQARRPARADRPAPAGRAPGLARPLALEGPGAAPLLDRRRGRAIDDRDRLRFWAHYRQDGSA